MKTFWKWSLVVVLILSLLLVVNADEIKTLVPDAILDEGMSVVIEEEEEPVEGAPLGGPRLFTQPADKTVSIGGKCEFNILQSGASGITWRFYNPATGEIVLASKASSRFKGLKVSGQNSDCLHLANVPLSCSGWQVYCTLANNIAKIETRKVTLTVLDYEGNAADSVNGAATAATPNPQQTYTATAINATLQIRDLEAEKEAKKVDQLTFKKSTTFRVSAVVPEGKSLAYWVINGVRYDFDSKVTSFLVSGLTENMVFEVVYNSGESTTLFTADQIQPSESKLTLESVHSRMCHVKNSKTGAGGYFTYFDFTNDYQNRATEKKEQGGQITVRVSANLPSGKYARGWIINGATYNFNSDVNYIVLQGVHTSMTFDVDIARIATAVPPKK